MTFNVKGVNEELDVGDLAREMALDGINMTEVYFKKDTINNKRSGKGVIHARAKCKADVEVVKGKLEERGMRVAVGKDYKPVWRI